MNFRVAEVTKPLMSVKSIVDRGNKVVFEREGSYIQNEKSGEKVNLIQANGVYVLEIPAANIIDNSNNNNPEKGFAGQGR